MFDFLSYSTLAHRRIRLLGMIVGLLFVLFVVRLFYIQVMQHDYYTAEARSAQVTKLTVFAQRGTIFARDDVGVSPLVLNETVYTVFADPAEVADAQKVKETMQRIAGGDIVKGAFDNLSDTKSRYAVIARNITRTQADMIRQENLEGIGLQAGTRRVYPEGRLAAQLLGYVNSDGQGQYGVEQFLNTKLQGQNGLLQSVTDVRRIPLTVGNDSIQRAAVNGDNIVLTIDRRVQLAVEEAIKRNANKAGAKYASGVVIEPNTGRILAMANYPSYDPAAFSSVADYSVFQNRTVDNAYEAGSVIKTLTVSAGLDTGAITPNSTSPNYGGCTQVEDRTICNVYRDAGMTQPTTQQLLSYSLNTGAVDVVRQLGGGSFNDIGRNKLYDYFTNHFALGRLTGIEQPNESAGVIYAPNDPDGNNVRYSNMSFGHGMTVTMVQVASAFSAIVNGGTYYKPTLLYGTERDGTVTPAQPTVVKQHVIGSRHSAAMRDMIWHVRYDSVGKVLDPSGYRIGGKSGTAQLIDPRTGEYTSDRTIGSYVGYVGVNKPKYVIMVRIDDAAGGNLFGSMTANTTFGELARWMTTNMRITPDE